MAAHVTVAFRAMLVFIGRKALLENSFIAFGVRCVKIVMALFLQKTNARDEARTSTGFVKHALLRHRAMKMYGVTASNSRRIL
jgi:hypothetical protein